MAFFYIDFSCWRIEADNQNQAIIKAQHFMKQGHPCICSVEEIPEDAEGEQCEHIEYETET